MKNILISLAMLALLATPALAMTECPSGQHLEEVGSFCDEWSTPVCVSSHREWSWSQWRFITVCDAWSEPICLHTVSTLGCVDDPVIEPYCGDSVCNNGETFDTCSSDCELVCKDGEDKTDNGCVQHITGGSWVTRLPKVSSDVQVNNGCVSFLTTHNSIGGILMGKTSSQFPLDTYRKPYIDPIGWPICSTDMLGYEIRYEDTVPAVYHTICPREKGDYYVRPYMDKYFGEWGYGKLYGDEKLITL